MRAAMSAGLLACMTTPGQGNRVPDQAAYACDNGRFGKGWPGEDVWWAWLQRTVTRYGTARCLWATAPDVVGDAEATLTESRPWLARIRALGIPAAYVAQDGCSADGLIPWGEFDVLFLGGTDEFKLGPEAVAVTAHAKARGLTVHMGRVNSRTRMRLAHAYGCDSVDGTLIAHGPDLYLPDVLAWTAEIHRSPTLFDEEAS